MSCNNDPTITSCCMQGQENSKSGKFTVTNLKVTIN